MLVNETNIITWERHEAHGFPHFRSRGTASRWELRYDGDGWCLSQDGDLLEWYGVLDEAMALVAEEEARLGGTGHADGMDRYGIANPEQDLAGARVITLLENNDADLEIWNGDRFELRFLDKPSTGATLDVGYYPGSWPWFGCFSTPTGEDMATVNNLIEEGGWQVIRMSDRWGQEIPPCQEQLSRPIPPLAGTGKVALEVDRRGGGSVSGAGPRGCDDQGDRTTEGLMDGFHSEGKVMEDDVKEAERHQAGLIATENISEEERAFFTGWQPVAQFKGKDVEDSARLRRAIRAAPKRCWFNARRVVQKLDDYADALYIEGIACLNGFTPMEHGWVVRQDGSLIDPTLPAASGVYFPGLEFRGRAGIEEFLATPRGREYRRFPFFYAFGWGGEHSPGMRRAWEHGNAYLRELYPEAFEVAE
ncbi:hypothetical protein [Paludisphaera soli]|uniref:hypothetical protein n=1 Tax=Paludisphaera soli TaxID=2712865 RepID=UPI0013E9F905|nr:hypothetical protein [Paludisphaera soli]